MVNITTTSVYASLNRQVNHWSQAASRLSSIDQQISSNALHGIDQSLAIPLRQAFDKSVQQVTSLARQLNEDLKQSADRPDALRAIKRGLIKLRDQYLKAEETIHFFTVAINSRTTANTAALLRACDVLCMKSMRALLEPLGKETPYVLTYIDKGVGASILKAGLRLWDGSISPIAAIKVTQHNLFRPTAIIHETGHQVSHILHWNEELGIHLRDELRNISPVVADAFAGWSSEIAADAFAFVHTGYASVAALHDVVSGSPQAVFAYHQNDPHPIAYIRVLLGTEMCRQFYGAGAWDDLEEAFKNDYDINLVNFHSVDLIKTSIEAIPRAVRIILRNTYRAFNNRALCDLISPMLVSPVGLERLEYLAGPALYTSHAWIWKECIRLLALTGYKIGTGGGDLPALYRVQEDIMIKLGFAIELN